MKRIRIGNDFVFAWEIERNGLPEDLSSVLEKHLYLSVFDKRVELVEGVDYDITGNVIRIEVTPAIADILGTYKAEFHYLLPDLGLIDEDRKCAVDVDAFTIVSSTAKADDPSEFTVTSDMAIAFKGDKGDSSYQTWLDAGNTGTEEDYLDWIRQPATDIAETVNLQEQARVDAENTRNNNEEQRVEAEDIRLSNEQSRVDAEAVRVAAEDSRVSAETSRATAEAVRVQAENERETAETTRISNENNRVTAEQARVDAESLRATAESSRELAESLRVDAELLRQSSTQEAISNAENATENANTAAQNADDARLAIQDDLALKADQTELDQLAGDVSLFKDEATVKVENLINGKGDNLDGWNNAVQLQNVDGWFKMVSDTTRPSGNYPVNIKAGDKVYICYEIYSDGAPSRDMYGVSFLSNGSLIPLMSISKTGITNASPPAVISGLLTLSVDTNGVGFIWANNPNPTKTGDVYFRNIKIVNLTATFGAGNEPTKEEMDLLISTLGIDYFEGEITIPAQKIMQWELALIRKNKNAIIALGGTII